MGNKKIGVNAYGLRFLLEKGVEETLWAIKGCGLDCLEPMVALTELHEKPKYKNLIWPMDVFLKIQEEASGIGIEMPSVHCFLQEEDAVEEVRAGIRTLWEKSGVRYFVFSDYRLSSLEKCMELSGMLRKIISGTAREGIMILYHPHENEFVSWEGKYLIDHLLENTPGLMLQVDMGWVHFAGVHPLAFMRKYKERVRMLHFKDLVEGFGPAIRRNSFAGLGKGVVDYKEIFENMDEFPLNDYCLTICQDNSNGDLLEDLRDGVRYIRDSVKVE